MIDSFSRFFDSSCFYERAIISVSFLGEVDRLTNSF